jgi:hypothetical protein
MRTFWFVVLSLVLTQAARRLGWLLSRGILYPALLPLAVMTCISWGAAVAIGVHALLAWLAPHAIAKWVLGFAQGAYAAVPNYGLFQESTIPPHAQGRHQLISILPVVTYVAVLTVLELRSAA